VEEAERLWVVGRRSQELSIAARVIHHLLNRSADSPCYAAERSGRRRAAGWLSRAETPIECACTAWKAARTRWTCVAFAPQVAIDPSQPKSVAYGYGWFISGHG